MVDPDRTFLNQLGLPAGDLFDLPASASRFSDGAHFRTEVSTINSAVALGSLLNRSAQLGILINRVGETYGIFRHRDAELKEMLQICRDSGVELNLSVGPRATYDVSATARTPQGAMLGYRLRGMDQVVFAIEDVKRAVGLGCRGITLYDEGLLWVLHRMKLKKILPKGLQLKISAHAGCANPASLLLLEQLGADTLNPVRDLSLPMLAALRQTLSVPLDIHADNPPGSGGFIRVYEMPEIIRICAPIYMKSGNIRVASHGQLTTAGDGAHMAEQMATVLEHIQRHSPKAIQSPSGSGPAIPHPIT
jgi:hypothetical protein